MRPLSDSNTSRQRFAHSYLIFTSVVQQHKAICDLPLLVASEIDIDAPTRSRRLDFAAIDYKVDIESATTASLRGLRDEAQLQKTWFQLVAGDQTTDADLAKRVIRACAPVYEQRGLEPFYHLRKVRRGGVGRRRAA